MENAVETKITIYVDEQEQTFLFTCPKCGSHKLLEENTDAVIQWSVSSVDIESEAAGGIKMIESDYTRDSEVLDLTEYSETRYLCNDCPFELPVQDRDELAEWILNNCHPQN